jgi:hypothetical protein
MVLSMVDKAEVSSSDMSGWNGLIHVIDTVMIPAGPAGQRYNDDQGGRLACFPCQGGPNYCSVFSLSA